MSNNQSSIKQLFQKLWDEPKDKFTWYAILKQMEQLHKAEITRAASRGYLAASDDLPLETATGYGNLYYASQFNYPSCEGDNMNNNPDTTTITVETDETRINRAMNNVMNRMELNSITNELHGVAMDLTNDELLELIEEIKCICERYSDVVESRI